MVNIQKIFEIWNEIKERVYFRLREFENLWKYGSNEDIFSEFAFCILTPQSKAKVCWNAILEMKKTKKLFYGNEDDLYGSLKGVRFRKRKVHYIVKAREYFSENGELAIKEILSKFIESYGVLKTRDILVKDIKGMGYKEASHFLRNIGFGQDIAILDRHILRSLKKYGVIDDIPKSLTGRRYFEIEGKMREFSKRLGLGLVYLDFIFWYMGTGEVFK